LPRATASDYLRFALMLMHGGQRGEARILGRKTVEYMLSDQLGPKVTNLVGNARKSTRLSIRRLSIERFVRVCRRLNMVNQTFPSCSEEVQKALPSLPSQRDSNGLSTV
jgi:hypothetical protein